MAVVKINKPNTRRGIADNYNFLNEFLGNANDSKVTSEPRYKIQELADKYVLEFAVPGLTKNDLSVEVDSRVLSVKTVELENGKSRTGFADQSFDKQFRLSNKVNTDEITATTLNGILTVEMFKIVEEVAKPARAIEIV